MRLFWQILALVVLVVLVACAPKPPPSPNLEVILAAKPAANLSAYGLFNGGAPSENVTAYDLVNPLFTDYAQKQRHVFIPKGKHAQYNDIDAFDFPVGSVLIKTFGYAPDMRMPDTDAYKIETRLLIRKQEGWAAYPYIWNKEQAQAVYAPIGGRQQINAIGMDGEPLAFTYVVPNVNQCKTCHQSGHDITPIGPKARNLNHNQQIESWASLGILRGAPLSLPSVPKAFDVAGGLNDRARAYLDINCAHCHKAQGSASNSGLWLEWGETSPVKLGINKHPTAAGRGAGGFEYVIEPGHANQSILSFRMNSTKAGIAMPELGRSLAHEQGVQLIDEWIGAMASSALIKE